MSRLRRYLPILDWLPSYDRSDLRYDVMAGVTVSALVIPKALGYAGIAQVPLAAGLYAAAAGAILYALFGTSRQISTGPSSALAAVAASAVAATGLAGDDAARLVAGITVAAGLAFVALAAFRMGWVSSFLSKPVITGFLFGAAIEVVIGELPKISGTTASGENSWQKLAAWLDTVGGFHLPTFVVGIGGLATILVLRFVAPR
ncbi:MAG: SulP family inorganic anion transporter, partial [Acidimicrobiia bacterium]|nr:SulP family inorganic anion transporter [Acidimicrobiia bacterium]